MRNISIEKRRINVNLVLERLGLLLVGLQECQGSSARYQGIRRRYILLRVGQRAPLLAELGGDVLDGHSGVGFLDLLR